MTPLFKLFADFNNTDTLGRVRLNTNGSLRDLKKIESSLKEGLEVLLDDEDDVSSIGILEFSKEENIWVAKID